MFVTKIFVSLRQNKTKQMIKTLAQKHGNVTLKGFGMSREVFIDGEHLKSSIGSNFDWGWDCSGSSKLARAILDHLIGSEFAERHGDDFQLIVTNQLPTGNFSVELRIKEWSEWEQSDKLRQFTAYNVMNIIVSDNLKFPKYLDFPSLNYKSATFNNDTIEYKYLAQLQKNNLLDQFNEYLKSATLTLNPITKQKDKYTYVIRVGNIFELRNGLGSETFTGFNSKNYAI